MKEKSILASGASNKPVHSFYHILPGRKSSAVASIICEHDDIFWFITPAFCEINVKGCRNM